MEAGSGGMMVMEGRPKKGLYEVLNFCRDIGLPCTLEDLNLADATDEELIEVAKKASDTKLTG